MSLDKSRRSILKMAGTGAAIGLAGCMGDGGSSDSPEQSTDTPAGQQETGSPAKKKGTRFDGQTLEWWEHLHGQARQIGQFTKTTAQEFESDTGATVKLNQASSDQAQRKWRQNFATGTYPHLHSWQIGWSHNAIPSQFWYNFNSEPTSTLRDYRSLWDSINLAGLDKMRSVGKYSYRAWPKITNGMIPDWTIADHPIFFRTDLVKKAGVMDKYPPTNVNEIISIGTAIKQNTDAVSGFQIPGAQGECGLWPFSRAQQTAPNRNVGHHINKDYTKFNINNKHWKQGFEESKRMLDSGMMAKNTLGISDEKIQNLAADGRYGGGIAEAKGHALLFQANAEAVKSGKIDYVDWVEDGFDYQGNPAGIEQYGNVIPYNPNASSHGDWKNRQEIGAYFRINYRFGEEYQVRQPNETKAFVPSRMDVWDQALENLEYEDQHGWGQFNRSAIENTDVSTKDAWPEYIAEAEITQTQCSNWQKMMQGSLSAQKAVDQWYVNAVNNTGSLNGRCECPMP